MVNESFLLTIESNLNITSHPTTPYILKHEQPRDPLQWGYTIVSLQHTCCQFSNNYYNYNIHNFFNTSIIWFIIIQFARRHQEKELLELLDQCYGGCFEYWIQCCLCDELCRCVYLSKLCYIVNIHRTNTVSVSILLQGKQLLDTHFTKMIPLVYCF